jgi:hypothetical protein
MTIPVIVTGDDVLLPATLKKDNQTFTIAPTAIVQARIVSTNNQQVYSAVASQSSSTAGADWANSLVMVSLPSSLTIEINFQGKCELEVQVEDNSGKTTWFSEVEVKRGNIA